MNKYPILLLTNNREDYLLQTLNSLIKCDSLDKFILHSFEEPPSKNLNKLFNSMQDHIEVVRHINKEKQYINRNLYNGLDFLFNDMNYDFITILEDDLLFSKDALNFALWTNEKFKDDEKCFGFCLNYRNRSKLSQEYNNKYKKTKYFSSLGWGLWKNKWNLYYNELLPKIKCKTDDNPNLLRNNWDRKYMKFFTDNSLKYFLIKPIISRSNHIGIYGENCKDGIEWHTNNIDSKYWHGNPECNYKSLNDWEYYEVTEE